MSRKKKFIPNKTVIEENVEKSDRSELSELQKSYDKLLKELDHYRNTTSALEKELNREKERNKSLKDEFALYKKEVKISDAQLQKLERQYGLLQVRYDSLANSKLGRLTLYHWAKQKRKGKSKSNSNPFLEAMLSNVPSGHELRKELEGTGYSAPLQNDLEMSAEQEHWIEKYAKKMELISESNGSKYYSKPNLKIGIICDEFFYDSISAAADFVYLTPDNWNEKLDKGIDVLLFVSAWRGLANEWKGMASLSLADFNEKKKIAVEIINICKERGIQTIFYSKEDPPNYEMFLDYARLCDIIFTSAKECIPYYKKDCNNENVYAISFGINPKVHNPIGFRSSEKENTVLFSGSWMKKYPHRCKEISIIFDGIMESDYDLHIIDRNYPTNKNYMFPEKYFPFVSPAVDHIRLQKVHKLFDWAININSVKASETMFANRAYELQANGILLMSNFSVGVNNLLPTVMMIHDKFEPDLIFKGYSKEEIYERQIFGIRSVMTSNTCHDRIRQFLAPAGFDLPEIDRSVLVISDKITDNVQECFESQSYGNKTLMLSSEVSEDILTEYDMVTWFSTNSYYGVFYLEDMVNAFKYTASSYITKNSWYSGKKLIKGTEHDYTDKMSGKYRTLFWVSDYSPEDLLNISGNKTMDNGYSIDHFSYNERLSKQSKKRKSYELSVIIPIYNNGRHLYGKCFGSLMRSSIFDDMEIIIVDDGSSDEYTLNIKKYLTDSFSNVSLFSFNDGGSGSASRPRNKGVELSTGQYITFLDPDNEAVCDGYARLLERIKEKKADLIFGNMYKCTIDTTVADNYSRVYDAFSTDMLTDGFKGKLSAINFLSISIQAMVIRKEIITENQIEQVEGAADQDTLFSWQLLHAADKIVASNQISYISYKNDLCDYDSLSKLDRACNYEKIKYEWLRRENYISDYMLTAYETFAEHLLRSVCSQEIKECRDIIIKAYEILSIYKNEYDNSDHTLNEFFELAYGKKYKEALEMLVSAYVETPEPPMLSVLELLNVNIDAKTLVVSATNNGDVYTFRHEKYTSDATFAWVILDVLKNFEKMLSTKYTSEPELSYDFSQLVSGIYKVRAFMKNDKNEKVSEDVALLRIHENRNIELFKK